MKALKRKSGFTILEIMIVIVIIALLAAVVVPRIAGVSRVAVQSSVRRYNGLVRYAYDNAVLTGRVHRIVLNLDEQSWFVEAAEPGILPTDNTREEIRSLRDSDAQKEKEKEKDASFKKVGKNIIDKIPGGVSLVQFESWRIGKDVAATKGVVYIYAYPSGFIDEATVVLAQFGKEKIQSYRITTRSLTGRVEVNIVNDGKVEAP